jgi:hypothetical protein
VSGPDRTFADLVRLGPSRTDGPDRTFGGLVRWWLKVAKGGSNGPGRTGGQGTHPPYGGASVPVRWVRPASWGSPAMDGWGLKI